MTQIKLPSDGARGYFKLSLLCSAQSWQCYVDWKDLKTGSGDKEIDAMCQKDDKPIALWYRPLPIYIARNENCPLNNGQSISS